MKTLEDIELVRCLSELEDTRAAEGKRHNLQVVVIMSMCAILCNANSFGGLARFAKAKLEWFEKYFDLPHGAPSRDTFIRVFALLKPEELERCFLAWIQAIKKDLAGETIAIDGKTLRGSYDTKNGLDTLHLLNVYAVESGLVLMHKEVDGKTNEITVIPDVLKVLNLKGTVVTTDAMGCQKEIAKQIIDNEADYLLALKGNQGFFYKDVVQFLESIMKNEISRECSYYETINPSNHGREEIRKYYAVAITKTDIAEKLFTDIKAWKDLRSVVGVESIRTNKTTGETSMETRFYISSLEANAESIAPRIRGHWSIENSLHYVLDVTFKEDASRIRERNATKNFSLARKLTLNIIKLNPRQGRNYNYLGKREMAGWNNKFLEELLFTS
jgi:predicted transposase YbfD/YdcC